MPGQLIVANGIELWVDVDGAGDATAVLLLGGADASVLRWPPEFVAELVDAGFRVIRLEPRDCGLSSKIDADRPYRLDDLVADAVAVLAVLDVVRAHVVGYSLGGAVAQLLALDHPSRVRTLTLVATTPGLNDERLPFAANWFVDRMAERLFAAPPRTHGERVDWTVDLYRMLAGDRYTFDEHGQRALADAEVTRCWYPDSGHGVAANASPSRLGRLGEIVAPTIVVHGTRDPVYGVEHAQALAGGIVGAELVLVAGLGHEVPRAFASELAAIVLSLITRA